MAKVIIDQAKFIGWYFDPDTIKDIGEEVRYDLDECGEYHLTLIDIFKRLNYIPISLVKRGSIPQVYINSTDDLFPNEIENPSGT